MNPNEVPLPVQNQIIVQRLFESDYKPQAIWELQINGLKRTTIFNQCQLLSQGLELKQTRGPGREKVLSEEDLLEIADYLTENPDASAPDVRKHLSEISNVDVSDRTIQRALNDLGLRYKHSKTVSFLGPDEKRNRVKWAFDNLYRNWEKVLYTDEATFWLGRSGVARWKPSSEANEHMVPKYIPKLNVWLGFCSKGKVSLKIFKEKMNAEFYVGILEEKLPEVKKLFKGSSAWSWQQDNDPKHTSILANKWFDSNRLHLLEWPSYSPDVNPVENLWGWIKKEIAKKRPKTLKELEESIIETWNRISDKFISNLVASMPKRCTLLIAGEGERIKY